MKAHLVFCVLLLYSIAVSAVYTDIYRFLDAAPCVLLLNGTGPIGCSAPEGGTTGDLYVIRNADELDYFHSNINEPKAVALPSYLFNRDEVFKLHNKKAKGALLLYGKPASQGWSPDTVNPNSPWGFKSEFSFEWNPQGDGLNFDKIPFPVYSLSANESEAILALATNDTSFPRHAVKFNTFMHATQNAKTCLRRYQCQPVGGKSVWSSFTNITGQKEIVMAMANIDSSALFHDLATGADSTVSGIVGLIGAAMALQNVDKALYARDIIFSFWSGESWGYMGSRKFLDDIQNFKCEKNDTSSGTCDQPWKVDLAFTNIKLANIVAAIEFNQIGLTNSSDPALFVHQQGSASTGVANILQEVSSGTPLAFRPVTNTVQPGIPPSSMVPFLMANPNLPGVVVSDHIADYTNLNFHSHTDNAEFNPLSNASLCNAATVLARTLYLLATEQTTPDPFSLTLQAPCELLANLTMCLSDNFNCPLLDHFLPRNRPSIPTYYTGVFGWSIDNAYASAPVVLVNNLMSLITASNVYYNFSTFNFTQTIDKCKECTQNQMCVSGTCVTSETHYHDAISLGIDWDYKKNNWIVVNESEPTWVESNWDGLGVELYRRENPTTEGVFLAAGIIELLVSLVAVFYAKRYFMRNYKIF